MPIGHSKSAGGNIEYGNARVLFPVEEVDATVYQYRDAELALNDVNGEDVIIVSPTSLATGYFLGQHTLTAIPVESLAPLIRTKIGEALNAPIETFELIQIGKRNSKKPNRSLTEFTGA